MLGNLFGGRKKDMVEQAPTPAGTEVTIEQKGAGDLFDTKDQVNSGNLVANPKSREDVTALSRLDPRATKILTQAQELAKKNNQATVEPLHLLYGLLYDSEI